MPTVGAQTHGDCVRNPVSQRQPTSLDVLDASRMVDHGAEVALLRTDTGARIAVSNGVVVFGHGNGMLFGYILSKAGEKAVQNWN